MYSRWVRRVPRNHQARLHSNCIFEFSRHYALAKNYVQELRICDIVVQLQGSSLPTCHAQPERNAAIKLCLFKPFTPCAGPTDEDWPNNQSERLKWCARATLWRAHHNCAGKRHGHFGMQWLHHSAQTEVLRKRAAERRISACSVPTIHDTWACRAWYPKPDQGGIGKC